MYLSDATVRGGGGKGGFNGFNYVLDSINTSSWLGHFSNFETLCSIVWVLELVPGDTWSTSPGE